VPLRETIDIRKMLRYLFLFIILGSTFVARAQPSDFLALKKKNGITIKNYFAGIPIDFYTARGEVSGIIRKIDKDTIYITYHDVRMAYTMWGTQVPDTVTSYDLRYSYKDIIAIPKKAKGFEFVRDGSIFILGGTGFTVLHLVNSAIQSQPVNWKTVGIAMGVAGVGVIMRLLRKHEYKIGKKYTLNYINMK